MGGFHLGSGSVNYSVHFIVKFRHETRTLNPLPSINCSVQFIVHFRHETRTLNPVPSITVFILFSLRGSIPASISSPKWLILFTAFLRGDYSMDFSWVPNLCNFPSRPLSNCTRRPQNPGYSIILERIWSNLVFDLSNKWAPRSEPLAFVMCVIIGKSFRARLIKNPKIKSLHFIIYLMFSNISKRLKGGQKHGACYMQLLH